MLFCFVLVVVLVVKVVDQKRYGLKKFWVQKVVLKKDLRPKKFGQNWVSNLIWIYVTRTYFSWTNVIVTVGIFERWSQKLTFEVWSKSVQ